MRVTRVAWIAFLFLVPNALAQEAEDLPEAPAGYSGEVDEDGTHIEAHADATSVTQDAQVQEAAQDVDEVLLASEVESVSAQELLDASSNVEAEATVPVLDSSSSSSQSDEESAAGGQGADGGPQAPAPVAYASVLLAEVSESVANLDPVPSIPSPDLRLPLFHSPESSPTKGEAAPETGAVATETVVAATEGLLPASPLFVGATLFLALTTVAGASASSGSTGLLGLKKFLARLAPASLFGSFTRLSGDQLLDHPRRNEIAEYVRQNPGERLEIVRKALGLANGPMLHHLRMLDQGDLVRVVRVDGMARLYPAGPRVQPAPYILPVRRRLLEELRTRPGITQREIAQATGLSERIVSYHVGWLNTNGLVSFERAGAAKRCFAAAPTPPA